MKKILTFSVFYLLFSNPIFSQILTFKELMDLSKCRNHKCFDNYITKKGFRFLKYEKSLSREVSYNYISNDAFLATESLVKNEAGIIFPNNLSVKTFFRTNITQQYQSILTQIKQSGFEADKAEFPKNGVRAYYLNPKMYGYQIVVSEYRLATKGSKKFLNLYEVSVLKNIEK